MAEEGTAQLSAQSEDRNQLVVTATLLQLNAAVDKPTGSLIRQRGRNPRFEQLDLTEAPPN